MGVLPKGLWFLGGQVGWGRPSWHVRENVRLMQFARLSLGPCFNEVHPRHEDGFRRCEEGEGARRPRVLHVVAGLIGVFASTRCEARGSVRVDLIFLPLAVTASAANHWWYCLCVEGTCVEAIGSSRQAAFRTSRRFHCVLVETAKPRTLRTITGIPPETWFIGRAGRTSESWTQHRSEARPPMQSRMIRVRHGLCRSWQSL